MSPHRLTQAEPQAFPLPLQKHCDRQKANLRIRFKPSLFQHVGTHSSLAGKIQKLKVGCATPRPGWGQAEPRAAGWGWGDGGEGGQGESLSRGSPC